MNIYNPTPWKDDIYDEESGELIQEGTPLGRKQFYNMETGILAGNILGAYLLQHIMQHQRALAELEGEIKEISLTNNLAYPFNNSEKTVALDHERDTLAYQVGVEVISADGLVGDIEVYDKALNGFKIRYTGSAENVTLRYYVQGGML